MRGYAEKKSLGAYTDRYNLFSHIFLLNKLHRSDEQGTHIEVRSPTLTSFVRQVSHIVLLN